MRFRQFDFVLSEDEEVVLLMKIINEYINDIQSSGGSCPEADELKEKILRGSVIRDVAVDMPFGVI